MKSNNQVERFIKSSILLCRLYADTDDPLFDRKFFYLDFMEFQPKGKEYLEAKFTLRFEFDKHKKTINWRETAFFSTVIYLSSLTLIDSRRWSYQIYGDGLPLFDLKNLPRVIDAYFKSQNDIITNMNDVMMSYHKIRNQAFKYIKLFNNNEKSFSPIANYIINNI